ncbi:glycosyltransferase family 4 protein [Calidifontibacter sp. DB0510]|uniref:Glycosyltransferase family 4 protein n=1 Tax=Metallococcus carri TaxID=1656884 RepID=A0A967B242_9MICO|nr:glycosyltransferase family 4 protein [Metallococcus carri]NHN56574.1 glycosyltransferase family 4 protein [Metallococcus carri]NOP38873.1 glycosyltransferase family 4 protein [Calidifontibacter sp. DB2511S]
MPDPVVLWVAPVANLARVARHILDVARVGLPGWRLVVTAPEGPLLDELRGLDCPVIPLDVDGQSVRHTVADLRRTVTTLRPQVVHSHLAKADFLAAMATTGLPTTLVSTEHHIPEDPLIFHGTRAKAVTRQVAHRVRIRRFAHLIAVSESTARDMRRHWQPSTPISVVRNGIDRLPRAPRGSGLRILSLARLSPEKNIDQTLAVFARLVQEHPDASLTIAGDGPEGPRLHALASELGVTDRVSFPGHVDPVEAMQSHDVLLQPSRADNLSYTLLDAVNHGMGVVASDIGGNGEILPPHCLAPVTDTDRMVAATLEQGTDPSARPAVPEAIPTVTQMTEKIVAVYRMSGAGAAPPTVTIAANQGEIGGGEVMLLRIAQALRALGHQPVVAAPAQPAGTARLLRDEHFDVVEIPGTSARSYLANLRRWDRRCRRGALWCNGLRPALATAGHPRRVVHLHQIPTGKLVAAARTARAGTIATVVPSHFVADRISGSTALWNWTAELPSAAPREARAEGDPHRPMVLGYLGRLSTDKGVAVLGEALQQLHAAEPDAYRLVLAGESRFVDSRDAAKVHASLAPVAHLVDQRGWIDREEFFSAIDLAIFPSTWDEPFGLVVAEAMAARCPFVISDAGALPEVAGHTYPWIARAGDPRSLATMIARASRASWPQRVEASYGRWLAEFSPDAGRDRFARLLHDLGISDAQEGP